MHVCLQTAGGCLYVFYLWFCCIFSPLTSLPFYHAVLASGVSCDGFGHDPGSVLRPDTPALSQQTMEAAALAHILLSGWIWSHSHNPLDLPHRWFLL